MSQDRTLTLNIDSSIASGVAALVLDILLLNLIKFLAQLTCSCTNLYLIYDKRAAVSPKKSIFSSLTGGPIGPGRLAHFFSILLVFVTACVIVLGFSINGKTQDRYEKVAFKSLVRIGERPADIIYEREFERRRGDPGSNTSTVFISKRLAAVSDSFTCLANRYSNSQIFAFAYKNLEVDYEMVEQGDKLRDAECITSPNFKVSIISREYPLLPQGAPLSCIIVDVADNFPDSSTKIGTAKIRNTSCDFNIAELQCYREDERIACAAMAEAIDRKGHFIFLIPNIDVPATTESVQVNGGLSGEERRKLGMNVAFLSTAGFSGGVANLANMAISDISSNVDLERKMDTPQQVSEIDLRIAIPMLGVVMGVAILVGGTSLCMWLLVVYYRGRTGYNKFSSVCDILELANSSAEHKGRFRMIKKRDVFIGVSRSAPEIMVVGSDEKDVCSNSVWNENEIAST